MIYQVVCVWADHPDYERVIGPLRTDEQLLATMWAEAESRLDEHPAKAWWVAVPAAGEPVAMAWAAAVLEWRDGRVWARCCNSYDRPGYRHLGLYPVVYRARHEAIRHLPAVTYVFEQPLELHLADGWRIAGEGDSNEPDAPSHHWWHLVRDPE